jgi:RNA polymerase sigma factor (sigma-70 family)
MKPTHSTISDEELIVRYKASQDNSITGELYKRYSMLVFGLCYKYLKEETEAQDAVTEIFVLVIRKLADHEVSNFKSWLYSTAKNYLIRRQKRLQNQPEMIEAEKISENFMENEPDRSLYIREQDTDLLQQAISHLNDEQRTCIELFYLQQKPYIEVASITGYDLKKVKSAIQNGKRNLKLIMEEKRQQHGA